MKNAKLNSKRQYHSIECLILPFLGLKKADLHSSFFSDIINLRKFLAYPINLAKKVYFIYEDPLKGGCVVDDLRIIELLFERSELGVEQIVKKYGDAMFTVSYNILRNREDAEECVNDSYLNIWNSIPPTKPNSLYAFVCGIARNLSLTRYKHNKAEKRDRSGDAGLEEIADIIPSGVSISDEIEREELSNMLNTWLGKLDRDNLYIFVRRYWYMDKVSDIARNLRFTEAAVYLRLDRMKKSLYKYLSERGAFI